MDEVNVEGWVNIERLKIIHGFFKKIIRPEFDKGSNWNSSNIK